MESGSIYKKYVLGISTLVYAFNYFDRQILAILAEPIKNDLGLQDWQLGFLTGTVFAIFYVIMGIPIARFADRYNRVNIVTIALVTWSFATAVCGAANNLFQLAIARLSVGVGEAGGSPPIASLLADYFDRYSRSTAMGIYNLGVPIGTLLGFAIGGWVNEHYGWRMAFLCAGIPGLVLAAVYKLTVREPKRSSSLRKSGEPVQGTFEDIKQLVRIPAYRMTLVGSALYAVAINVFYLWTPVNMLRTYDLNTSQVGLAVGLLAGVGGALGTVLGGTCASMLSRRDIRWLLWTPALSMGLFFPFVIAGLMVSDWWLYVALLAPAFILSTACLGGIWAVIQNVTPSDTRAMAFAVFLFFVNLIGLGLGPQLSGLLSDLLRPTYGEAGLRISIGVFCSAAWASGYCFLRASSHLDDSEMRDPIEGHAAPAGAR